MKWDRRGQKILQAMQKFRFHFTRQGTVSWGDAVLFTYQRYLAGPGKGRAGAWEWFQGGQEAAPIPRPGKQGLGCLSEREGRLEA